MDKHLDLTSTFHFIQFHGELYQSKDNLQNIKFTINTYLNYNLARDEHKARHLAWNYLRRILENNFKHNPKSRCWSEYIEILELNKNEQLGVNGETNNFKYSNFQIEIDEDTSLTHSFIFEKRHLKASLEEENGTVKEKNICVFVNAWVDSKFCPDSSKAEQLIMQIIEENMKESFTISKSSYSLCQYLGLVEKNISQDISFSGNIMSEENLFSRFTNLIEDTKSCGLVVAFKRFCHSFCFWR